MNKDILKQVLVECNYFNKNKIDKAHFLRDR